MKLKAAVITGIAALVSATNLFSESLVYPFTDGTGEPNTAFLGDVANGVIVMDTVSGAFFVEWYANTSEFGGGFRGPMEFVLHLINPDAGNVVTLSGYYADFPEITRFYHEGVIPSSDTDPGISDWHAGQAVQLNGSFNGVEYVSGTYTGTFLVDKVASNTGDVLLPDPDAPNEEPGDSGEEPVDSDMDGVPDEQDEYGNSDTRETVFLLEQDTGIANRIVDDLAYPSGHTLADIIQLFEQSAAQDARNHGQYVSGLVHAYRMLASDGLITGKDFGRLVRIVSGEKNNPGSGGRGNPRKQR